MYANGGRTSRKTKNAASTSRNGSSTNVCYHPFTRIQYVSPMQTKLYPNKKVARMTARTLKVCNPDFSYRVGHATAKPAPTRGGALHNWDLVGLEGYFCIRRYLGEDFHSFA